MEGTTKWEKPHELDERAGAAVVVAAEERPYGTLNDCYWLAESRREKAIHALSIEIVRLALLLPGILTLHQDEVESTKLTCTDAETST